MKTNKKSHDYAICDRALLIYVFFLTKHKQAYSLPDSRFVTS